jgi:HAD superfamily hydrolase (TIGR01509 family)
MAVEAVVFDLDGVLVDTEPLWAEAKHAVVSETGGRWKAEAPTEMLGMSGPEWSVYMRDELAVPLPPPEIRRRVVEGMLQLLESGAPIIDGAPEVVRAIATRWPVAVASSADRPVIEAALRSAGLAPPLDVVVSSDEAGRGKPAPDVYLAAAACIGVAPESAVAVEDSANGMRAAKAAAMSLVAIPRPHTPVDGPALALADLVLDSITDLTPERIEALAP